MALYLTFSNTLISNNGDIFWSFSAAAVNKSLTYHQTCVPNNHSGQLLLIIKLIISIGHSQNFSFESKTWCGMVSTKKVCSEYVLYTLLIETISTRFCWLTCRKQKLV